MAQYHNNKEKNKESWSNIVILSCQNKIKNKSFKMGHPNVHLYIASTSLQYSGRILSQKIKEQ